MRRCLCKCGKSFPERKVLPPRHNAQRMNAPIRCDYRMVDNYLLTRGAKATITSEDRADPLLRATTAGFSQVVRMLLRHGTDLDVYDMLNRTALHLAVSLGHIEIVHILLRHRANLDTEDAHGYTPLCEAVWRQSTDVVEMLLNAGAKLNDQYCLLHYSVLRKNLVLAKLLLAAGADANLRDGDGDTPLIIAARTHDIDIAKLLLENGAKPDYQNNLTNITPLHLLVSSNCNKEDYTATFEAFVNLLIQHEVDLDMGGPVVGTALTKSLLMGKYRTAQFLIQMGADVNKLPNGVSPPFSNLRIAFRNMRYSLVHLLVAAGYDLVNGSPDLQIPENDYELAFDRVKRWLLNKKFNPHSLADICRVQIRKDLGSRVSTVVPTLDIPKDLHKFLMLEGISDEKNQSLIPFQEWH